MMPYNSRPTPMKKLAYFWTNNRINWPIFGPIIMQIGEKTE